MENANLTDFIRDSAESAECLAFTTETFSSEEKTETWVDWLAKLLARYANVRSIDKHSNRLDDAIFAKSNPRVFDGIPECEVDLRIQADLYPLTQIAELFENGYSRSIGDLTWTAKYVCIFEENGKYYLDVTCDYE